MELLRSLQHPLVKSLVRLRKERKERKKRERLVIFGHHLVSEICSKVQAHAILTTESALPSSLIAPEKAYQVTPEILAKIAGVQQANSILAEVPYPTSVDLSSCSKILVLDRVSDPGNLGTLIRTALALGWDGVYILDSSVDPYNDKAIRASKGALFRLKMQEGTVQQLLDMALQQHFSLCVADTQGKAPESFPKVKKMMLVLGNESHGPSEALIEHGQRVSLPMPGEMESLNVAIAGGILMYTLGIKEKDV